MTDAQAREAARQFYYRWKGKGKEDEDARSYWIELLQDIFGMERATERLEFEKKVAGDRSMKRIDAYIPETHVVIEQKSLGIPLDKPQPGHENKTPYEQAKEYDNLLPYEERARWIITSNFSEIWIYDMAVMRPEPVKLAMADLQTKYHLLDFLINKKKNKITEEVELSKAAGELVGKIRDRFLTQYNDPLSPRTQKSLNILCVRLVFCFFAEDAALFGEKDAFSKYILRYRPGDIRSKLLEMFRVLDTPLDGRADLYLDDELAAFPYVNGGLFSDENIVIPKITQELKDTLTEAARFDWSRISPTIFGAVFESTLNPETRRSGGMHYTSIENIHRLIDPLFLDDLRNELKEIQSIAVPATQKRRLAAYQDKLASLIFFDPACGSGNFLTETYLSLRRLENKVLRLKVAADRKLTDGQISFGFENDSPIKVSIRQFYGIEINDFACSVAQTALWIAESQMMKETEDIVHQNLDFFPLKEYKGIAERNALRVRWADYVPVEKLSYIIGNPPFVGQARKNAAQTDDMQLIFGKGAAETKLDYVICWYKKAAELMKNTAVHCALVSTNSICQGESVPTFWKNLISEGININFAWTSFKWSSEASDVAAVHCVIVGFSFIDEADKKLFDENGNITHATHINPYLYNNDDIWLQSRVNRPLNGFSKMTKGSEPTDGGNFFLTPEQREQLIAKYPTASSFIRPFIGGKEFTQNKVGEITRYCLWFKDISPSLYANIPEIKERLKNITEKRKNSSAERIRRMADYPYLFCQERQPESDYLLFPRHTTSARRYIPFGFMDKNTIVGDSCTISNGATLYDFGLLISNVHMAWTRVVCGRLGDEIRYSQLVYNNFPTPSPSPEQRIKIETTARGILQARALYPDSSLADLYDPLTMPPELRKAHQLNDKAVMQAYGMPIKETDESACVAWLMRMYQDMV